jgi:hypothetical protein
MAVVDRKQPAIVGGVIVGLLSVIPFVSAGNFCCCLWALLGGIVAAKMLIDRSPEPVKAGDGAMIGLLAGLIGGAIYLIIGIPLSAAMSPFILRFFENFANNVNDPQVQEMFLRFLEEAQRQSFAERLIGSLIFGVLWGALLAGFTTLGGLLGVAFFEKRKGQTPPPPPQYPPPYPPNYPPTPPPPPGGGYGGEPGS